MTDEYRLDTADRCEESVENKSKRLSKDEVGIFIVENPSLLATFQSDRSGGITKISEKDFRHT